VKEVDISFSLKNAGIYPGDTLMIHGDAIVAAQLVGLPKEKRLEVLFDEITRYLGPGGTLVVPAFSYSFTKDETFDVLSSPSTVGAFSEQFRLIHPNNRSKHPIFSVTAIGRYENEFINSCVTDCFGEHTCFQLLHKLNGKLMNLGCDLMLTYTHYCEQVFGVSYRYFKNFRGFIVDSGNKYPLTTRYFVGERGISYSLNLERLKRLLCSRNELSIVSFGRVAAYSVSAKDYFNACFYLLAKDEMSLIEEGIK
jgi:aminoglycoside 3-N-acetyltransferase